MSITLDIHICDQRRSYLATFATEDQALEFIDRKTDMNHAFHTVGDGPLPGRLEAKLFPTCAHGLSASLCMGPGHYPTDEQLRH